MRSRKVELARVTFMCEIAGKCLKIILLERPRSITTSKSTVMPVCITGDANISNGPLVVLI
jgi:hypothetical protein